MENKVKRCCDTCEFNAGIACMGYGKRTDNGAYTYGMSIKETEEMFPNGCEDWGISFAAYQSL